MALLDNSGEMEKNRRDLIPNQMPLSAAFMRCQVSGSIILYIFHFSRVRSHRVCEQESC